MIAYPVLTGEIAKRGIKKEAIAKELGITSRALNNKINGNSSFLWDEVLTIRDVFFPDYDLDSLFQKNTA